MEKLEYRSIIKFFTKQGKDYKEIHQQLVGTYAESAPSLSTCKRLNREFRLGRDSITDEPRTGRPSEAINPQTIDAVKRMVQFDPRIKIRIIAASIGLSYGSVSTIIHNHLHMNKLCARWVPRNLSTFEKDRRVKMSQDLLEVAYRDPDEFLSCLITEDETWIHQYDPTCKRDSYQWTTRGEPPPVKVRSNRSAGKIMLTVFWDKEGPLLTNYIRQGETMTGIKYANLLRQLRECIKEKRRGMLSRGVRLLQDNASSHSSIIATTAAKECGIECLPHPAYSPDLAPSDYFLFPKLKKHLKGTRYSDDNEVIEAVESWFASQPKSFYHDGLHGLFRRLEKCIFSHGEYFEQQ